jgi:DNA-binding GntR family transcriptional regulator
MGSPKWQSLADDIRDKVKSGRLKAGDQLPSTRELCAQYKVSTIVVRNAMLTLKTEGLVKGVPGVGVFVIWEPE